MTFHAGFVALVGVPNVGKSTLLNAILGERIAAVTAKPQTTRHRITGIHNADDAQIIFLDTPGYHHSPKALNRVMHETVQSVIHDADVVCLLIDVSAQDFDQEEELLENIGRDRCVVIANKADLIARDRFQPVAEKLRERFGIAELFLISAAKREGIEMLLTELGRRLPEAPPYFPQDILTSHPMRFLVAELIREEVFLQLHAELPYSSAVEIIDYKEPRGTEQITRIWAEIIVERESQKGMVIGRGARRLREIGSRARRKIEELIEGKVFLDLRVRVKKDWTKDERMIRSLGFSSQLE